jgi:hypothetical protein
MGNNTKVNKPRPLVGVTRPVRKDEKLYGCGGKLYACGGKMKTSKKKK